eukprot:CAMPEP_0181322982 /NCGR_PEP_ID=MMETSP1101-20121128/19528_1 /TAXON_ID=46948 /ORGANISM="Rhodomonas abbreviata, Strain Caron Lab Isolate" /LENGTH=449 /DNA_ID=CAMNT_0023430951 /DNA_START=11 /DNA_END=1360 /DNA_ORIENTATION=-
MISVRFLVGLALVASTGAFNLGGIVAPTRANLRLRTSAVSAPRFAQSKTVLGAKMAFDMEALIQQSKDDRLTHLEEQAMGSLKIAADNFDNVVFPNACIAGDCVITHLLSRLDVLKNGKVKIMVVDTFHLFPETMEFVKSIEDHYGFKAEVFQAEGCADKAEYDKKFGADLWKIDIEQYDKVCKVEPFQRGLKTLKTEVMINGRRRDHGVERAYIDLYENAPIGGGLAKVNPLAYWTFEDCFDYIAKHKIPIHPLHAEGYPSIGDAKDTVKVPADGSVKFVDYKFEGQASEWLDYAAERKGRFVGLANKDGSVKTECGIHVAGAERTFERDLWEDGSKVKTLSKEDAEKLPADKDTLVVTYAPWCPFCQQMEDDMEAFAAKMGDKLNVVKYRGDEDREFVGEAFKAQGFPTISLVAKDGSVTVMDANEPEDRSVEKFGEFVKKASSVAA